MTSQPTSATLSSEEAEGSSGRGPWIWVGFALLGAFLVLLFWASINVEEPRPLDSGTAPDFTLTSFEGETIRLSELRGNVVVINFWASWCVPCRAEAEYLETTWRRYRDEDVVFIGIDYADSEEDALEFIDEYDITYFNGPDVGTRVAQDYRLRGVPETYYVARDGELEGMTLGPLSPPELERKIEALLTESATAE